MDHYLFDFHLFFEEDPVYFVIGTLDGWVFSFRRLILGVLGRILGCSLDGFFALFLGCRGGIFIRSLYINY